MGARGTEQESAKSEESEQFERGKSIRSAGVGKSVMKVEPKEKQEELGKRNNITVNPAHGKRRRSASALSPPMPIQKVMARG